jgi:uncharacterized membrane protein YraQ (UPF0718 family)
MYVLQLTKSLSKTVRTFFNLLPIIIGILLLSSLIIRLLPGQITAELFGGNDAVDAVMGALVGGVAAGHPLVSYLLAGELLKDGVSLIAVTAFLVSWVTVGVVQLPAEVLMLGARFAIYRNLGCFFSAIAIAFLTEYTLRIIS